MNPDPRLFQQRHTQIIGAGDRFDGLSGLFQSHAHIDESHLGPAMRGTGHHLQEA